MAKLTKRLIDGIQLKSSGQTFVWDEELRGFGLCVGRTAKSYVVQRDLNGKSVRITIGKHGVYTPEEARLTARDLLNKMARGQDPRAIATVEKNTRLTLSEAWEEYQISRHLKPRTRAEYDATLRGHLAEWLHLAVASISSDTVSQKLRNLSASIGPSGGSKALRIFRAIYNFAAVSRPELPPNPTDRISRLRLWHRERRRRSYLTASELPRWLAATQALNNENARDFLMLSLFTGMRKSEAAALSWRNIDFVENTVTVPSTKNGDALVLPLVGESKELLRRRFQQRHSDVWVFPAHSSVGHLTEPKKWVSRVAALSGIHFSLHDLRRTFVTVAESLDISAYTLKRLLNHRESGRDVTAGYIILDVERLRDPMTRIDAKLSTLLRGNSAEDR